MDSLKKNAYRLIILLGVVSLCGDIVYEGARSVSGPYLFILGATATAVGLVSGVGEFIGYALRILSGYLADKTRRYWFFTGIGYGMLASIPLLAFAGYWQIAAVLLVVERAGKALRVPARDTILSYATKQVGRGWGFAIHEAFDQIGAIVGPLIFCVAASLKCDYQQGFYILWVPVACTFVALITARFRFPKPERLETATQDKESKSDGRLPNTFYLYALFTFLSVIGFVNFQVLSFHLKNCAVVSDATIPLFYAIAMGVDAVVALVIGRTYDKIGLKAIFAIPVLTIPIPFFAFTKSHALALVGIILWGMVMGNHEAVMRAAVADLTPLARRGTAYGLFNTLYGVGFLLGGGIVGLLYDKNLISIILIFVVLTQVISILALFLLMKTLKR